MRRHVTLLIIPALSLLALGAVSCQDNLRENLPVREYDLKPAALDLSATPADLSPPPDLKPADGGPSDGGVSG